MNSRAYSAGPPARVSRSHRSLTSKTFFPASMYTCSMTDRTFSTSLPNPSVPAARPSAVSTSTSTAGFFRSPRPHLYPWRSCPHAVVPQMPLQNCFIASCHSP